MSQGLIPQDVIDHIKERTDIAEVVSGYVALSRTGQNLKGLCPFHAEKTPSFTVSPSRQIFHCFGCGVGGNVYTFVMKIEGTSFPETVRELARKAGIEVPVVQGARPAQNSDNRERLEQLNDVAAAWFRSNLREARTGKEALAYLHERGMTNETIDAFGFGFALDSWDGLLRRLTKEGYTVPLAHHAAHLRSPQEGDWLRWPYLRGRDAEVPQLAGDPPLQQGAHALSVGAGARGDEPSGHDDYRRGLF